MLVLNNLLQGTTPVYDAQAIPDATDFAILCAAIGGNGVVANDSNRTAPVVSSVSSATATLNTSAVALSSLTGTQDLTCAGFSAIPYAPSGYLSVPTTGGGNALIGYNTTDGLSVFHNCFWISGGSGNIANGATFTSIYSVQVAQGYVMNSGAPVQTVVAGGTTTYLSLQNQSGTAWQSLPPSAGDRIDTVVCNATGTLSIVAGTACSQLDWTRSNGSYTNAAPAMAAWSSSTPIILTAIYVPGTGSSHGTGATIGAGQLTDKTVGITPPILNQVNAAITGGADIALSNAALTTVVTLTLTPGTWTVKGAVAVELSAAAALSEVEVTIVAGTATLGTLAGQYSGSGWVVAVGDATTVPFNAIIPVTAAGTVLVRARKSGAATVSAKKNTTTSGYVNATGAVALRAA